MKTTAEKIAVMQAYEEGKLIETRFILNPMNDKWKDCPIPLWNWLHNDYRIKSEAVCQECIHYDVCYQVAEDINVDKCEHYRTE